MRLLASMLWPLAAVFALSVSFREARADDEPAGEDKPADQAEPAAKPAADDEEEDAPARKKQPAEREEEVLFRGGISGGGGIMYFTTDSQLGGSVLAGVGGVDGRVGVQFNDLIGLYVQPQVGLYGASGAIGGLAGGAVVVDFTFFDQLFVGAGAGAVVLNNPAAAEVILRVGGYPAFGFGEDGNRRKGLMLGIDFRLFIAPFNSETIIAPSPTFNIGYEAY